MEEDRPNQNNDQDRSEAEHDHYGIDAILVRGERKHCGAHEKSTYRHDAVEDAEHEV